jgi:hypothetical protein
MLFRLRFRVLGDHTHVRVFAGKGSLSLGCCGDLTFRNEEWTVFKDNLARGIGSDIEVVPESNEETHEF